MSSYRKGEVHDLAWAGANTCCIECGEHLYEEGSNTVKTSGGYYQGNNSNLFLCCYCLRTSNLSSIAYVLADALLADMPPVIHKNTWWSPTKLFEVLKRIKSTAFYSLSSGLFYKLKKTADCHGLPEGN